MKEFISKNFDLEVVEEQKLSPTYCKLMIDFELVALSLTILRQNLENGNKEGLKMKFDQFKSEINIYQSKRQYVQLWISKFHVDMLTLLEDG